MGHDPVAGEFGWRPRPRDEGPIFRDLSWDFEEPDEYPALVAAARPGFLASKGEKAIHRAIASGDPEAMLRAAGRYPRYRLVTTTVAGLVVLGTNITRGIRTLEETLRLPEDVARDSWVRRYLPTAGLTVVIAAGVMVHLPLARTAIARLVAELHQARGEGDRALAILADAEPTTHVRLSVAELEFEAGRPERVLEITDGIVNDDDVTALMLAYRGRALAVLERQDEALAALELALEYPNRAEAVKAIARVGRGLIRRARGDEEGARDDFEQAVREVPNDPEAHALIARLVDGGAPPPGSRD